MKLRKLLTSVLAGVMIVTVPVIAGLGSSNTLVALAGETSTETTPPETTTQPPAETTDRKSVV